MFLFGFDPNFCEPESNTIPLPNGSLSEITTYPSVTPFTQNLAFVRQIRKDGDGRIISVAWSATNLLPEPKELEQ